jgi:hypothetical protein
VILDDPAGVDGLTEHTVRALNIDMLGWDRDRGRYGWPQGNDAPMLWSTYLAWKALTRLDLIPGMALSAFESKALQVEVLADDTGKDGGPGDPTQTGPGPE